MFTTHTSKTLLGCLMLLAVLVVTAPALAMNDPVTGRWLTRDPLRYDPRIRALPPNAVTKLNIRWLETQVTPTVASIALERSGDSDSWKLYEFLRCNPAQWLDPSGYECSDEGAACAAYASNPDPNDPQPPYSGGVPSTGGVICCNGEKIVCSWILPAMQDPQGRVDRCNRVHEETHLDDVSCTTCQGIYRPPFDDISQENFNQQECTGSHAGWICAQNEYGECLVNPGENCDAIKDFMKDQQAIRNRLCVGGVVPGG